MNFNWETKTILIAEDEPVNFLFIKKILEPTKATIIKADNGEKAINIVKENNNIDIVLMDIYMPEVDGFEATKEIKKINPDLPVIAQTFHNKEINKEKIQNASFNDFIDKPINVSKLLIILDKYLK
jgi:CheY-like chemotaxis protein